MKQNFNRYTAQKILKISMLIDTHAHLGKIELEMGEWGCPHRLRNYNPDLLGVLDERKRSTVNWGAG